MHARTGCTEREYLATEAVGRLLGLARATVRRAIRGRDERRPDVVRANYDQYRAHYTITDFEDFVLGDEAALDHVLVDDRIIWADARKVYVPFMERLSQAIESHVRGIEHPVIVEFGCGRGRNLFYLKKRFPHWTVIGLEISPVSLKLCRDGAAAYGLDIDFRSADVTQPIPDLPTADVCISVHALEQMPRVFSKTVATMMSTAQRAVLFFEPVGELYSRDLRGLVGRMRLREHDYLDGLYDHLRAVGAHITKAERMRSGANPLNETVEIHVSTTGR